jgi:RHS repeat-associated protein
MKLQGSYAYDKTGNRTASKRLVTTQGMDCTGVPPGGPCTPTGPVAQLTERTYGYALANHRVITIGNTERRYDAAGNTIWIGPSAIDVMPPNDPEEPPPDNPLESAAYSGTEQATIGIDDGNPPPGIATKTFAYNAANRMASVSVDGSLTMSYRYTGNGERVYRSGSGQTAHTVFDPSGRWIGDYDENGQTIQQAIWLGDLPVGLIARVDGQSQLFYLQPDALGTPRVVIDPARGAQGAAIWRWELENEAFGEDIPNDDPDNDGNAFVLDMRFPGQQYDSATGFNYNYFRDYDTSIGRYVQSDPIGLIAGVSTYGYVEQNPLAGVDPYGLETGVFSLGQKPGQSGQIYQILQTTYAEMKDKDVPGTDQFFHCLATCRATKATGQSSVVRQFMNSKEFLSDYPRGRAGFYGDRRRRSHDEMAQDVRVDQAANEQGMECPPGKTCEQNCRSLLDNLPARYRPFMQKYRRDW